MEINKNIKNKDKKKSMDFEKIIKHLSDVYLWGCSIKKEKGNCEICNLYSKILKKYDFVKSWDHED